MTLLHDDAAARKSGKVNESLRDVGRPADGQAMHHFAAGGRFLDRSTLGWLKNAFGMVLHVIFLPEAKPTGLVEAMSVRPSVAFSHFGHQG